MKSDLKRNISVVCILAGLGLVCLGAGNGIWPGDEVQNVENTTPELSEVSSEADVTEDDLADTIIQVFSEQGGAAEVQKVSWGSEELPEKLWDQMDQWRRKHVNKPFVYKGYIELQDKLPVKQEEGALWEYATV